MFELSCGNLADIVHGRLHFGAMPPLGGPCEPVMRIVLDSRAAQQGDVFWDLPGDPQAAGGLAEEAFSRGATGVVSARPLVEPWAGAFAVRVADARRALLDLGAWARAQSGSKVVTIAGGDTELMSGIVARSLCSRREARQLPHEAHMPVRTAPQLALRMIEDALRRPWQAVGVAAVENREWCEISHLCHSDAAVIYSARDANTSVGDSPAKADDFLSLVAALPQAGRVLLGEPSANWRRRIERTTRAEVLSIGRWSQCDWPVDWQAVGSDELRITMRGERLTVATRRDWDPAAVVLACATARILGATRPAIVAACDDCHQSLENHGRLHAGNMEVPPQVSGLRESDTSLPPGLKRYAC